MTVSVGVVAYNESNVINGILEDLAKQDYPHEKIELLLVDSASTDDTGKQLEAFAARQAELGFKRIQVLDNPKRKQAAGWNVVIQAAKEDILIRIDAHASIPEDFIGKNVRLQESGEKITGEIGRAHV